MSAWQDVRASFRPVDLRGALFLGLILGLGAFWNGALIIAALLILGASIVWAPRRGDLLVCCAVATILAILEARGFITSGPGVSPKFRFGFLADPASVVGVAKYYLKLLGLFVPLVAIALWRLRPRARWLLASLLVPIAFATLFTFTPDVSVNHKFVNAGVRIAAIFVAALVISVFDIGRWGRVVAASLIVMLTATGVVDFIAVWNANSEKRTHNLADPMLEWARKNTDPSDVFAAPPIYHHIVYFTGRKSYLGLPYWAESAGYDVAPRIRVLKGIYEGANPEEIRSLANSEHISYLIVDDAAREYFRGIREDVLRSNFRTAFSHGRTQVYQLAP
jgi:hypothetical protein